MEQFINPEEELDNLQLAENESVDNIPEDPSNSYASKRDLLEKTKIVKQTWSILEIYQKIKSSRLNLSPDYQRNNIWKSDKQTAFIESLFMGILIPPIYVVEIPGKDMLEESTYEVVDGKQRLSTISAFLTNKLALLEKSLEYYTDLFKNKRYGEIAGEHKELTNAMLSSVLDIYVITANSPEFTKYDIFSRLNKGAEKLKVNEIRKAIYRSDVLLKIDDFVKNNLDDNNHELCKVYNDIFSANDQKRYEDYGRFYRSVAFYIKSDLEAEKKVVKDYNSRPRDMINNVLSGLQRGLYSITDEDLNDILQLTLDLKMKLRKKEGADYIIDACIPFGIKYRDELSANMDTILADTDIQNSLPKSPATTSNVNVRLERVYNILLG